MENTMTEGNQMENTVTFCIEDANSRPVEMLRLDSEGFWYNGQLIKDAGEAHKRFIEWLDIASKKAWVHLDDGERYECETTKYIPTCKNIEEALMKKNGVTAGPL